MITFFVTGQSLNVSQPVIAADTIDYLEATVLFQTQNWAECNSIWAHFKQGEKVYDIALRNGKIEKGQHLNLGAGEWLVYLHGTTPEGTRITTTEAKMTVQKTGMLGESPLPEIPLSVAEQISQIAQSVRDDADAGKFDGGYYTVKASISDNNLVLTFTASKEGMKEIPPQSVHIDVGEVDPETISQAVEKYLKENPISVPVTSVNGKTGKVELTAKDVKALPDSTKVPTKTSELTNDAGFLTSHQSLADYAKKTEIPKNLSQLSEDATHRVVTDAEKSTWNGKSNFSGKWQDLQGKPDIPTKLPNPNKLTFNGAVTATYDGSSAVTVTIPQGSSSAGGTSDHRQLTHRDDADQHKIQAITGLQSALDGKQLKGNYALKTDKLANPHALTINGQQYDGSKAVSVEIKGGEGSGGEKTWTLLFDGKLESNVPVHSLESDLLTSAEDMKEFIIAGHCDANVYAGSPKAKFNISVGTKWIVDNGKIGFVGEYILIHTTPLPIQCGYARTTTVLHNGNDPKYNNMKDNSLLVTSDMSSDGDNAGRIKFELNTVSDLYQGTITLKVFGR